jgi:hydrogenase maturation protein HypF
MADARNEAAVGRLRERKHREEKPFALLFPSLQSLRACCQVSPLEERLLCSSEAPIVLLYKIRDVKSEIANSVAPGNPTLGAMLPSNPLHYLLMAELGFPVVATSGNLSDEPICTEEREAVERLGAIADLFLVHNRPIVRHVDDSIARVMLDREMVLRRARGYAPLPILLQKPSEDSKPETILAVGAHLKNSIALAIGEQVFISQHIGDLETEPAYAAFRSVIKDFERLYETTPERVVADLHPDYLSTKFARDSGKQVISVQHHVAHILSCMAENEISAPALGVSWDGTGLGLDGTIWGGEFFLVTDKDAERVANFRPFRLPGRDQAVKEPRRAALGLLYEVFGDKAFELKAIAGKNGFSVSQLATLKTMLSRGLNSPLTSSVGRLFDAVAGLVGLRERIRFEGQAAMELEFALDGVVSNESYVLPLISRDSSLLLDWEPMVRSILADVNKQMPIGEISARFHNALVEAIVCVAQRIGEPRVALSGGCFQNRYLTERTVKRLREEGFQPYWHQRVPPNDGGIALGQIVAAVKFKH